MFVNFYYDYRFPCEVRVRSIPLTPCRRKKRKDEELDLPKEVLTPVGHKKHQHEQNNDVQVQSPQVCNIVTKTCITQVYKLH